MKFKITLFSICLLIFFSCSNNKGEKDLEVQTFKGLYIFGPEFRTLTICRDGREYWVVDSSKVLEFNYAQLNFEKPYLPVYVEVEGRIIETNGKDPQDFDSTIVVTKLLKLTKEAPPGDCLD